MPHRVEPHSMSTTTQPQPAYSYAPPPAPPSKQRRSPYERPANNNRASSPPPITTLPGSPSPPDRSAVSTPPAQQQQQQQPPPPPHHYATYDMQRYPPGTYMYAPPPPQYAHPHPHDQRYDPQQQPQYAHAPQPYPGGYIPYPLPGTVLGAPTGAPGAPASAIPVVHTDDAATKLSDRVRRRCFNCCTTDTSTWRRSNLSPGKVLCNKCGLFERTHSRPRPEQFPHKRGPLAASTLRAREGEQGKPTQQTYQPYPPPASAPPAQNNNAAPAQNGAQNGSASHPGTPNPNAAAPNGNANGASSRPASRGGTASRGRSPE